MKIAGKERCLNCLHLKKANEICEHCGFQEEQYQPGASSLAPGTCLAGRYFLGRVLGAGGFGITYVAWDVILEIPVAVKEYYPEGLVGRDTLHYGHTSVQIHEGGAKEEFQNGLRSFLREARTMSRFLNMRGIVSVRDFFQENDTAYIVMEYIDGVSMKQHIRRHGKMAGDEVLRLMEPVLISLYQMHGVGLIHRDISADNLMLTREGEVRLIDFGAARANTANQETLTISIKRGFSPQEQYRAKGEQGPWTDLYSLCATMYYMLTGEVPEESVERMVRDKVVPLTERTDVNLSQEQKKALDAGMAVMPSERLQNIRDLYAKLYPGKQMSGIVMDIEPENGAVQAKVPAKGQISKTAIQRELNPLIKGKGRGGHRWLPWVVGGSVLLVLVVVLLAWKLTNPKSDETQAPMQEQVRETIATPKPEETSEPEVEQQEIDVPDVVGLKYKRAKRLLRDSEFDCERVWVKSKKTKNTVIRQSIKAGNKKKKGTRLILYVSKGMPKPKATVEPPAAKTNTSGSDTSATTKSSKKDDSVGSLDAYLN